MPIIELDWISHDLSAYFMNNSGAWVIHESSLLQMQGLEGEAVVYHRETRHNAADAVRSVRPEGKRCR